MAITFDPGKRDRTMAEGGLNFEDAAIVFEGEIFEFKDRRYDYGEERCITVGYLIGRMVIVAWTPRGRDRHVFSMTKANAREQDRYGPLIGRA